MCTYGMDECSCQGGTFHCHTCPGTQPMSGDACTEQGADCAYGSTSCRCGALMGGNPDAGMGTTWSCQTCPATQPMDGSSCMGMGGLQCDYSGTTCACFGGNWNCTAGCPSTQPNPGDPCMTGQKQCTYGMTTCNCQMGQFFCN